MSIDVQLPEIGDGIESGDVLEVFVAEGDSIQKDQMIVELETDKATVPIYSTHAGQVSKVHIKPGDTVNIGAALLSLEAAAAATASNTTTEPTPAAPPAPPTPVAPPTDDQGPGVGNSEKEQPALEPEAPAAKQPAPAPVAPVTPQPAARPEVPATPSAAVPSVSSNVVTGDAPPVGMGVPAGPAVRRFAREVGVDLLKVDGTGLGGRITRDDVVQFVRQGASATPRSADLTPEASGQESPPAPLDAPPPGDRSNDEYGPVRIEKMSRIRRTIANNMHHSWSTVARVTNFDDADVTDLEEFRQASKADYANRGIKLTSMPFLVKAIASALRLHPVINASLGDDGQIIYKDYVNIGIAVDTDRGLVVPAIRNADRLSIPEIATELGMVAKQVRTGKFDLEMLKGGTFTVSNLGAIGGTYSTPIINTPEVAILLAGRSRKLPVVIDDQIVARLMMPLSLSYDHRLVDGAAAARFLNEVIDYLKAPGRLLLAP